MAKKTPSRQLPLEIQETDTAYPKYNPEKVTHIGYSKLQELGLETTQFTLYNVKDLGWVVCTLHISKPSKRASAGTPARTYGIGTKDKKVYTVGRGPHVLEEVTVYLTLENLERLQPLVALYLQGLGDASKIRDRISSRRAQGQIHRANGRTSWTW